MASTSVYRQSTNSTPLQENVAVSCSRRLSGSLLIGGTPEELIMLKERVKLLSEAGSRAEYLSSNDLLLEEPHLMVGENGGAACLPDDSQSEAACTVAYIEKTFASKVRYAGFHQPVTCLLRSNSTGEVEGVQTSNSTLYGKKVTVVASDCWSGSLMHGLLRESEVILGVPVKPRKDHLLVLENFNSLKLNHGSMEMGFVSHQDLTLPPGLADHGQSLSISMMASTDITGNLILESSRQFARFNTEVDESIIDRIWTRAAEFFSKLRDLSLTDFNKNREALGAAEMVADIGAAKSFKH